MDVTMTIEELRNEFKSQMSRLPPWIIGSLPLHHIIWQTMDILNEILLSMIVKRILTQKAIDKIIQNFDDTISLIIDNVSDDIQLRISIYYTSMVEFLERRTLEEEQYESCSNLKKFSDHYFKNIPTF
jgi:hypothetical protein